MKQKKGNDSTGPLCGRRDLLHATATGIIAAAAGTLLDARRALAVGTTSPVRSGIRAFKLYTGPDGASHAVEGSINETDRTAVLAIYFKETPAHSVEDWHLSPEPQYVITLSGTLEFTSRDGQKFLVRPGDVLLSEDDVGTGHKWRMIDDQPWRRAYVVLKPGAEYGFVAALPAGQAPLPPGDKASYPEITSRNSSSIDSFRSR